MAGFSFSNVIRTNNFALSSYSLHWLSLPFCFSTYIIAVDWRSVVCICWEWNHGKHCDKVIHWVEFASTALTKACFVLKCFWMSQLHIQRKHGTSLLSELLASDTDTQGSYFTRIWSVFSISSAKLFWLRFETCSQWNTIPKTLAKIPQFWLVFVH